LLHPSFEARTTPSDDASAPRRKEWTELLPDAAIVPVLSFRGAPPEALRQTLVDFIDQRGVSMVIVTGWPITDWLPDDTGILLTFGASAQVGAAAAAILGGEAEAVGNWRVTT
jgi:hypothetical protein